VGRRSQPLLLRAGKFRHLDQMSHGN
jgi:hypothetical protein